MDKTNAIRLLDETFSNDFDTQRFSKFIKELFNHFAFVQKTWPVWNEYQDYIDSYSSMGSYVDSSKRVIDILVVKLRRTSSRDRARTMQRNFVAKYLGNAEKDAALVAFYGDDEDWRFSFVKMEYNLTKDDEGKVKIIKELTPAKRYSFLVGRNEPNHTCKRQFVELLVEEETIPTLETIESAFSVDNVTKEFFMEYKELFLDLNEALQKLLVRKSYIKKEFDDKGISTVDFSKKLLGQIVFIYFLQKKGWLGVSKNDDGRFKLWGTGPKNFLRKLFDKEIVPYDNFFNDILEPLFYEALATERDDDYYSRFRCKIPFLNGGLFEPINDYDWAGIEISLENQIFNRILSTFDRFNFTVKEDEPLEIEVAVDPEMLGKVFENLLEVTDRKSKGAFYTPREIVHYICQQSLINYLAVNTPIDRKDIERFIQLGDLALSQIIREQEQIKKYGKSYDINEKFSIPRSIKENYLSIDELLREIRIVDPAVGSGAFPVGMMNEIVKARSLLSIFCNTEKQTERTNYNLKRETIENCLYGVDIEPSAVEITKLRFWLSLIVDEIDMKNIKPLPNLDHKIICGNSLLEEFEGIKLFDERLLGEAKNDYLPEVRQIEEKVARLNEEKGQIALGKRKGRSIKDVDKEIKKLIRKKEEIRRAPRTAERNLTLDESLYRRVRESQTKLNELKRLQKDYFDAQNRKTKTGLREQIDRIEWELIEETLKEQGNEKAMQKLKQYKKNKSKPFFLWRLYFAEVFQRRNPGFDVVIANPPYVDSENMVKNCNDLRMNYTRIFKSAKGNWDLFIVFIEQGLNLLRSSGVISYIVPNKLIGARYSEDLRQILTTKNVREIRDYSRVAVFKEASVYPITFVILNNENKADVKMTLMSSVEDIENGNMVPKDVFYGDIDWARYFEKEGDSLKILIRMSKHSPLETYFRHVSGAATVNEAYMLKKILHENKNPDLKRQKKFINTGTINPYVSLWGVKKTKYIKESYNYPVINNRDLGSLFPNRLMQAESEKLIIGGMTKDLECFYDSGNYLAGKSTTIILPGTRDMRFLLAILNSKLISFWYKIYFKSLSLAGGFIRIGNNEIKKIPLPDVNEAQQQQFIILVDQILTITESEDYPNNQDKQEKVDKIQREINNLVYRLYDLTPEEIKIIENSGISQ